MRRAPRGVAALVLAAAALGGWVPSAAEATPAPVVVSTFDTGTNPFHPCFRRPGLSTPRELVPTYPSSSQALGLTFADDYQTSLDASRPALDAIEPNTLYHVPETNLIFYGGTGAKDHFVDDYPHGAQASSQIACAELGLAPNALLVIVNWYDSFSSERPGLIRWAADQPWIDVIHLNIQDYPLLAFEAREVGYAVSKGKMVVVAAGNGVAGLGANYPMELSKWNVPGTLVSGANDNGGWTVFSNLNPHVVMDGNATTAAAPRSYGTATFSGTSSSSPRLSGYVARLLGELRAEHGHTWTATSGLLTIPAGSPRPATGPLADGRVDAAELHEVVRKTADPNPHDSAYDGGTNLYRVPQPVDTPFAVYLKMGYGEVSELTMPAAIEVLSGRAPMPARPMEDRFYAASEMLRSALWNRP